jgi:general stress protein YciG
MKPTSEVQNTENKAIGEPEAGQPVLSAAADTREIQPDLPPAPRANAEEKPRRPRGFAAMDRKLVSELARKGGKAAHLLGAAHEFSSAEAREAGRKGGLATHVKRRSSEHETK